MFGNVGARPVQLAGLDGRVQGGVAAVGDEPDRLEVRQPRQVVVRVRGHLENLRAELAQHVGARADRVLVEERSRVLDRGPDVLGQHLDPAQRVVGVSVGGLGEVDRDAVGSVGLDAGQRQAELVQRHGVQGLVEREHHVGAGERLAVGPLHPVPELHGERLAAVGPRVTGAQPGLDVARLGRVVEEQRLVDHAVGRVLGIRRVEVEIIGVGGRPGGDGQHSGGPGRR